MNNKFVILSFFIFPLYLFGFENQEKEINFFDKYINEVNENKYFNIEPSLRLSNISFHLNNLIYNESTITIPDSKYNFKLIPSIILNSKKFYIPNIKLEYYSLHSLEETMDLKKFNDVSFDNTSEGMNIIQMDQSYLKIDFNANLYTSKYIEFKSGLKYIYDNFVIEVKNNSTKKYTKITRDRNHLLLTNKLKLNLIDINGIKNYLSYEYDYSKDYRIHIIDIGIKYNNYKIGTLFENDTLTERNYDNKSSMDRTNIDLSLYVNYIF